VKKIITFRVTAVSMLFYCLYVSFCRKTSLLPVSLGPMRILLVDNYDSFTYNLLHYLALSGAKVEVYRNDDIPFDLIRRGHYQGVVISPGPQRPEQAGLLMELVAIVPHQLPMLGICLGMQALGVYLGMNLDKAPLPVHGKTALVQHNGTGIYQEIPSPTRVMRYHSLLLYPPYHPEIEPTGYTGDNLLMSFRHLTRPWEAVQFHPESIGTAHGVKMISNWVSEVRRFLAIEYK